MQSSIRTPRIEGKWSCVCAKDAFIECILSFRLNLTLLQMAIFGVDRLLAWIIPSSHLPIIDIDWWTTGWEWLCIAYITPIKLSTLQRVKPTTEHFLRLFSALQLNLFSIEIFFRTDNPSNQAIVAYSSKKSARTKPKSSNDSIACQSDSHF